MNNAILAWRVNLYYTYSTFKKQNAFELTAPAIDCLVSGVKLN